MSRQSILIFVLALAQLATTALAGRRKTHEITVAVMSINDFHSGFVRDDFKQVPGAPALLQTVDSLCQVYPYHLVLASGDNFGGSYFHKATKGSLLKLDEQTLLDVFAGVPHFEVSREQAIGQKAVDLLAEHTKCFASKGEMRKLTQGGGVSINKEKLAQFDREITDADLLDGKYILAQQGKKKYFLIIVK